MTKRPISPYIGVKYHYTKQDGTIMWLAFIDTEEGTKYIGYFDDIKKALKVREEVVKDYPNAIRNLSDDKIEYIKKYGGVVPNKTLASMLGTTPKIVGKYLKKFNKERELGEDTVIVVDVRNNYGRKDGSNL